MTQGRPEGSIDEHIAALAACESTTVLYSRLSTLLQAIQSLPAILYVRVGDSLHPVAGFDCSREVPAVPVASLATTERSGELPANQIALKLKGEVVGMLAIFGRVVSSAQGLDHCCTVLAVKLRHLMQEEALRRELHLAHEQLAHVVAAGELLSQLDIEVLLRKILECMLGAVRIAIGAVVVRDTGRSQQRLATWGMRDSAVARLRLRDGTPVVDSVLMRAQPLYLARDELQAALLEAPPSLGGLLVLPLTAGDRCHGAVILGAAQDFTLSQRRLAETLSRFAGAALENALQVGAMVDAERIAQELAIARSVQEGMYPISGLAHAGIRVEGSSRSCNETGGDYFTFLAVEDTITAMIADVSGHGLGAALFATMAHAIVQHRLHAGVGIQVACQELNQGLCHAQSGRFLTCAMVEIRSSSRSFSYVSAGHCPLLWIHQGEIRWLESTGMPLGIIPGTELPLSADHRMGPRDLLLLYTDGLTEATNAAGESFGDQRLGQTVLQAWRLDLGPPELMMLVTAEIDAWSEGRAHSDDLTMVVIRIDPTVTVPGTPTGRGGGAALQASPRS